MVNRNQPITPWQYSIDPVTGGAVATFNGQVVAPGMGGGNVTGPASAVADNFAAFNGTTGKLLKDSGVSAASFDLAGAATAALASANAYTDGVTANFVDGPAGATDGHVALFNGPTGLLIKDGGAPTTGDVVGPAGATDGHVALFDGSSGLLIKDGGLPVSPVEDIWTPGITINGSTAGITYSVLNGGKIFRTGNLAIYSFILSLSSKGVSVGQVLITGLPPKTGASGFDTVFFPVYMAGANVISLPLLAQITLSTGGCVPFYYLPGDNSPTTLSNTDINNGTLFQGAFIIPVD